MRWQFFSFHLHSTEGSECSSSFSLGERVAGGGVGNPFNTIGPALLWEEKKKRRLI